MGGILRAVAPALLVGSGAFLFRFLTLRDFANDHYMHLAWAQQLLLGEIPGRHFTAPGSPLTYVLSAAAQAVATGPLSEALLTIAMLAIAAAAVTRVVQSITGSVAAGVLAGALTVLMQPQLYSYPKVLAPAVALWLIARYGEHPSDARAVWVALWTAVAFLFRHDLGVFVATAAAAAIVVVHGADRRTLARHILTCTSIGLVAVAPFLLFVQATVGVDEYLRETRQFAASDAHQFLTGLSALPSPADPSWTPQHFGTLLVALAYLLVPLATTVAAIRRDALSPATRATITAAVMLLLLYDVVIVRHPLLARIRDAAALLPFVAVWTAFELTRVRPVLWRVAGTAAAAVVLMTTWTSVWVFMEVPERIADGRLFDGPRATKAAGRAVVTAARQWPWERFWPVGPVPDAVHYVQQCTSPRDHLLVTWSAPEYYFFAQRPFAAGHALFLARDLVRSDAEEQKMLNRLATQRVPVVLINEAQRPWFRTVYPMVDAYLERQYVAAGSYRAHDDTEIVIAVRRDLRATTRYGEGQWPCGFEDDAV